MRAEKPVIKITGKETAKKNNNDSVDFKFRTWSYVTFKFNTIIFELSMDLRLTAYTVQFLI